MFSFTYPMTSRFAFRSSSSDIFMKVCCYRTGLSKENKQGRDNRANTAITDIIEAFWQLHTRFLLFD